MESSKKYIKENIKSHDNEDLYFDSYDPEALANIIKTQKKVIEYMKEQNIEHLTLF